MTIFELIAILAIIGGLVWGIFAAAGGGLGAVVKGALLGAGKGFLFYTLLMLCVLVPLAIGLRYRPQFPRCRKGKCREMDFRFIYDTISPDEAADERDKELCKQHKGGLLVRCACGDIYLRSDRDRKFYEVREDRTLVPFMKHRFCGRWRPDEPVVPEKV